MSVTEKPAEPARGPDWEPVPELPPRSSSDLPGGLGVWLLGGWLGAFVAVLIVMAWVLGHDEGKHSAENARTAAGAPAAAAPAAAVPAGPGKQIFARTCGGCHTLKAAGTSGTRGPSLDTLQPDAAQVLTAIRNGGAGSGIMPPNLVQGKDAQAVADFVAQATGG